MLVFMMSISSVVRQKYSWLCDFSLHHPGVGQHGVLLFYWLPFPVLHKNAD